MKKTFRSDLGRVVFKYKKIFGNCGVVVIYEVSFAPEPPYSKNSSWLYKEFYRYLINVRWPDKLNKCKIIMSDRGQGQIDGFFQFLKKNNTKNIVIGPRTYNRETGNYIRLYEISRKVLGYGL